MLRKAALVTTRVENYWPELCAITMPAMERYAHEHSVDFHVITERQFPTYHPAYEKLQVHEIAKNYERTVLIDADILLHPRLPSFFDFSFDTVALWMVYQIKDPKLTLWEPSISPYFLRDKRNLGVVGCLVGASAATYDVFEPLPAGSEYIEQQLYRPAIIDEFTMSLNMAKYGLKTSHPWNHFAHAMFHADATTKPRADTLARVKELATLWS